VILAQTNTVERPGKLAALRDGMPGGKIGETVCSLCRKEMTAHDNSKLLLESHFLLL